MDALVCVAARLCDDDSSACLALPDPPSRAVEAGRGGYCALGRGSPARALPCGVQRTSHAPAEKVSAKPFKCSCFLNILLTMTHGSFFQMSKMGKGPRSVGKRAADGPAPGSTGRGGSSSTVSSKRASTTRRDIRNGVCSRLLRSNCVAPTRRGSPM